MRSTFCMRKSEINPSLLQEKSLYNNLHFIIKYLNNTGNYVLICVIVLITIQKQRIYLLSTG